MSSWSIVRSQDRLEIAGELRIADAPAIWKALRRHAARPGARLDLDLKAARVIDGAIMALLVDLRRALVARGVSCELVAAPPRIGLLIHLYRGDQSPEPVAPPPERVSPIAWLGGVAVQVAAHVRALVVLAGQLIGALFADVRRINWRAVPSLIERAGADGIGIIVVANFLMGFTMAYQSMVQLREYGANVYVADIVGISVTRELSPLMTAVLVVGRSGAAYAAELGAMRVSEEIDALRMMGFSPVSHLVAPRMVTLAITAPILTLFGDIAGIIGGVVVAVSSLGVSPHAYLVEMRTAVIASDVWTGLIKSACFGVAIAFIGCLQGLAASGAASGVGRSTTATVVASTFAIITIDAALTVVFRGLGL